MYKMPTKGLHCGYLLNVLSGNVDVGKLPKARGDAIGNCRGMDEARLFVCVCVCVSVHVYVCMYLSHCPLYR